MYENFVGAEETVCIGEPSIPRGSSVYSLYKRVYPPLEKLTGALYAEEQDIYCERKKKEPTSFETVISFLCLLYC